uniref:Uncharacterized protein n=1 Tax=Anguilla anguilla TaxID=7936 RepID=A0A0E9SIA1_ANGAN
MKLILYPANLTLTLTLNTTERWHFLRLIRDVICKGFITILTVNVSHI